MPASANASGDPLGQLSDRQLEILALMAEGCSNQRISRELFLSERTVESHIRNIFELLDLAPEPDYHRRVLAVLAHLGSQHVRRLSLLG
jgi:DNA-binding NarL/FixJ family response regulator